MSSARATTPRLHKQLKNKNLLSYANDLKNLGFASVNTICCLPEEEDTKFVKLLNIDESDSAK